MMNCSTAKTYFLTTALTWIVVSAFSTESTCAQTNKRLGVTGEAPNPSLINAQFTEEKATGGWPEIRPEMRPGAIWWWPNSAVTKEDLTWNLERYRNAGWGNMGIVGIYGVRGEEDKAIELFSSKWIEVYNHAITEAARLGMNIDLTPGGGWRWGGPHVTKKYAEQSFSVEDGVIVAQTKRDKVKRAGKGGVGLTINPYSQSAVAFHLDWFDAQVAANGGRPPRAFYYDSFENTGNWAPELLLEFERRRGYRLQDHAQALQGEGDPEVSRRVVADYRRTLSDLLIERVGEIAAWGNKKGSNLRMQAHGAPANLLDMYAAAGIPETEVFGASKFDIAGFRRDPKWIRADQQSDLVNRFASSAAHVAGRPLTTSESFTWLRNHYHTSLAHLKAEADKLLLNGINSIYYHGACFSPETTSWPGWLFYASTQMNPRNSIFHDVPTLNQYITRCQSVLQSGDPDNDVLLFWPVHDLWMSGGTEEQRYAVHHPEWIEQTSCGEAGRWLSENGYTFDFVSDAQVQRTRWMDESLVTEGQSRYRTILVPAANSMSIETAKKLLQLAKRGARVLVWRGLPKDVPGWFESESRKDRLRTLFQDVSFDEDGVAFVGEGRVICHRNLAALMKLGLVPREPMVDVGLQFIRRASPGEVTYFLANHTAKPIDRWVPISTRCQSALIMDPMTGQTGKASLRAGEDYNEVRLQMESGQTRFLRTFQNHDTNIQPWPFKRRLDEPIEVEGPWTLDFVAGGPTLPDSTTLKRLKRWSDLSGDAMLPFAGTAQYRTEFQAPASHATLAPDGWLLDLGDVRESARVWLNRELVGVAISQPFQIDLGGRIRKGRNELIVEVTNLAANRIRDLDRKGIEWKKFEDINFVDHLYQPFDASDWDVEPSGLNGPLKLLPYRLLSHPQTTSHTKPITANDEKRPASVP